MKKGKLLTIISASKYNNDYGILGFSKSKV